MTSGGELDSTPASLSNSYADGTKAFRDGLKEGEPSLDKLIGFADAIGKSLNGQFAFLREHSVPADRSQIRSYMVQEMNDLWSTRQGLLADLSRYFSDAFVEGSLLLEMKENAEVMRTLLEELDSIRVTVDEILQEKVWAAWDDLASEHVSSARRQESRTSALRCLQSLAEKWKSLSGALLAARNIGGQRSSA